MSVPLLQKERQKLPKGHSNLRRTTVTVHRLQHDKLKKTMQPKLHQKPAVIQGTLGVSEYHTQSCDSYKYEPDVKSFSACHSREKKCAVVVTMIGTQPSSSVNQKSSTFNQLVMASEQCSKGSQLC